MAARKGRFELAHGGTLFLDEIGDLSPAMQVKLLRVLQEREFERVGGMTTIKTDVRVIAATNRDLEALVAKEIFRQDLYYRLNVFPLHIPPLRERRTDILLLADYFVERYSRASGRVVRRISTPAIDMLMAYHWPGNVRELENCIERAVLLSDDEVIHGHHLPPTLQTAEASGTMPARPAARHPRAGGKGAHRRGAEDGARQHGRRGRGAGDHGADHGPARAQLRHHCPQVPRLTSPPRAGRISRSPPLPSRPCGCGCSPRAA